MDAAACPVDAGTGDDGLAGEVECGPSPGIAVDAVGNTSCGPAVDGDVAGVELVSVNVPTKTAPPGGNAFAITW